MLSSVSYTQALLASKANKHFCCTLGGKGQRRKRKSVFLGYRVTSESLLISQRKRGSCSPPEAKVQLRAGKWDPGQNLTSFPTASFQMTVGLAQQKSQPTAGGREAAHSPNLRWNPIPVLHNPESLSFLAHCPDLPWKPRENDLSFILHKYLEIICMNEHGIFNTPKVHIGFMVWVPTSDSKYVWPTQKQLTGLSADCAPSSLCHSKQVTEQIAGSNPCM